MKKKAYENLLAFLDRLSAADIPYHLEHSRDDAIMVLASAPGEYWEIEFVADGTVDVERFRSDGTIEGESALEELLALCSDEEITVTQDGKTARK